MRVPCIVQSARPGRSVSIVKTLNTGEVSPPAGIVVGAPQATLSGTSDQHGAAVVVDNRSVPFEQLTSNQDEAVRMVRAVMNI